MNKKEPEDSKPKILSRNKIISWAVFVPTIAIVLLSLIPAVFPALLTRATSPFQGVVASPEFVNPLDPSIIAVPLIVTSLVFLGITIAYYKKKECKYRSMIYKLSNFEFTKKQALIAVIVLLAIFAGLTASTLGKEETWVDYQGVKDRVNSWSISDFTHSFEPHIKFLLLSISLKVFGNIRVIPFITSIALLLLTYFFTKKITSSRFAGIVSMIVLLQSQIFISYSTTASYDNTWILLYLFSLYLVEKFWSPSPISYFVSIFSKALTVAFLPMSFYFIARSSLSKKPKIYSLASYGIIIILIAIASVILETNLVGTSVSFDSFQFWQGFSAMVMQMRFDYLVLIFLLPVTVMLFFASRRRILHADSILIFIFSILLTSPLLSGFTDQTNQPYRFVSLVVFFAIGVGVLVSKRTRKQDGLLSNMQ